MTSSDNPALAEIIKPENIILDTACTNRDEVIKAIIDNLVKTGRITKSHGTSAFKGIKERENIGTTAIGGGVAIPHARVGFCKEIVAAFALVKNGSGFGALDGAPVNFVFLILSPKDNDHLHVAFLKNITRFTSVGTHLKALGGCKTPEDVLAVFRDYA